MYIYIYGIDMKIFLDLFGLESVVDDFPVLIEYGVHGIYRYR